MKRLAGIFVVLAFFMMQHLKAAESFNDILESARTAQKRGNSAEAEKKFLLAENSTKIKKEKIQALLELANVYGSVSKPDWVKIERLSVRILDMEPDDLEQKILGNGCFILSQVMQRKMKEAEDHSRKIVKDYSLPFTARIRVMTDVLIEKILLDQRKSKEAFSAYREALAICGSRHESEKGYVYGSYVKKVPTLLLGKVDFHDDMLRLCDAAEQCKDLLETTSSKPADEAFRKYIRGDLKAIILLDLFERKLRENDFATAEAVLKRTEKLEELSRKMREKKIPEKWITCFFWHAQYLQNVKKQYKEALDLYGKLLNRDITDSTRIRCYLQISWNMSKLNRKEAAMEYLEKANSVPGSSPLMKADIMIKTAEVHFETDDFSSALDFYRSARDIPDIPSSSVLETYQEVLGDKNRFRYLKAGKSEELFSLLEEVEKSERLNREEKDSFKDTREKLCQEMIQICRNEKKYDQALQYFHKAMNLQNTSRFFKDDRLREARYIFSPLIDEEIKKGNFEEAERFLQEFKDLPDAMKRHKYMIDVYEKEIAGKRLKETYGPILEKIKAGQFEEAEVLREKFFAKPELSDSEKKMNAEIQEKILNGRLAAINRESSRLERKRLYQEAADERKKALAIKNAPPDAVHQVYISLARIYTIRKDYREAEEAIRNAENLPDVSEKERVLRYFGWIDLHLAQRRDDKAMETLQALREILVSDDQTKSIPQYALSSHLRKLADCYIRMKQTDMAVSVLEEVLSRENPAPVLKARLCSKLAEIYLQKKHDPEKAEEYLKKSNDIPNARMFVRNENKWLSGKIQDAKKEKNSSSRKKTRR